MKLNNSVSYENSFVLLCGYSAVVKKVLSASGVPQLIREGTNFSDFFGADGLNDWQEMIASNAVNSKGFYLKGLAVKIQFISYSCFASILDDEKILVIGIETQNLLSLYEEMSRINSRLTNSVRQLSKDKAQHESTLYDEISRMNNELANAKRELQKKNIELKTLNDKLEEVSVHDPLTGLYNRRYFYQQSPQIVARLKRSTTGLCLVMIDVNGFKKVNDTLGHDEGDDVLQFLAECFKKVIRKGQDTAFRLGGDEFLVILEQCDVPLAQAIMARLRDEYRLNDRGSSLAIGIIEIMPDESCVDLTAAMKVADELMYQEKMKMKNKDEGKQSRGEKHAKNIR